MHDERLKRETEEGTGFLLHHTLAHQSWNVQSEIYYDKRKVNISLGSAAKSWLFCYVQSNTFLNDF